jgi:hypothetical protein
MSLPFYFSFFVTLYYICTFSRNMDGHYFLHTFVRISTVIRSRQSCFSIVIRLQREISVMSSFDESKRPPRDDQEAAVESSEVIPYLVTADGKPIPRNKPCPCGSKHKYKKCCGKAQDLVVRASPRIETTEIQNLDDDESGKGTSAQAQDNDTSATNEGQSPQENCRICSESHSYDTKCPNHRTVICRKCWTAHVKHEISLDAYNGCRCPFCRSRLNNDIIEEFLPYQRQFQAEKSLEELEEMRQGSGASSGSSSSFAPSGPVTSPNIGFWFREGQRGETAAAAEERRAVLERIMAESAEWEARSREVWEQWWRSWDTGEEGRPVNDNIVAQGYDEHFLEAE